MRRVEAAELGFAVRLFGSRFVVVECCRVGKLPLVLLLLLLLLPLPLLLLLLLPRKLFF